MRRGRYKKATVVIIHGFGGKRLWMLPLAMRLKRRYHVINWSYFSLGGSIENHAARFREFLAKLPCDGEINVVAHSMGSIVTRAAMVGGGIGNVNRVVMLAPPNSGSHVAKHAKKVAGFLCKPIAQLSSDENSYVNQLPKTNTCETGVIASRYDVLVPVSNTYMEGLSDHKIVNGTHNSLLFSKRVAAMTDAFIQKGRFAAA